MLKNSILQFLYKHILKPILFLIDPEKVHDSMTYFGKALGKFKMTRAMTKMLFFYSHNSLNQEMLGIHFPNPVGLAAGFDKNAELTDILPSVGFGFIEVGSITGKYCEGNPKPRVWRLKKSKALVINYGLKNNGAEEISSRLKSKNFEIPIGISIAKTNDHKTVSTQEGIDDYMISAELFQDVGDYITINISCPNAFGGEPFTDPKKLDLLLREIKTISINKPLFLKLPSKIPPEDLDQIIDIAQMHEIKGFVCSNLSKDRSSKKIIEKNIPHTGGISGKVTEEDANRLIRNIYKKTKGDSIIIGCGGIFSAEDAYKKIKAGASLVQLITGMIFEGPQLIGQINYGLAKFLKRDGFTSIKDAVGVDIKFSKEV